LFKGKEDGKFDLSGTGAGQLDEESIFTSSLVLDFPGRMKHEGYSRHATLSKIYTEEIKIKKNRF
jgi:hypothetical protein